MKSSVTTVPNRQWDTNTQYLRVVLEVEFPDKCPLSDPPEEAVDIEFHHSESRCLVDFVCNNDASATDHGVSHHIVDFIEGQSCDRLCEEFFERGCVPHVVDTTNSVVTVCTYLCDRDEVKALIADIRSRGYKAQLLNLSSQILPRSESNIAEVDLAALTDKQIEALRVASDIRYYSSGTTVTLQDLAEEIGISASALSQRLTRAEDEIISQLFGY